MTTAETGTTISDLTNMSLIEPIAIITGWFSSKLKVKRDASADDLHQRCNRLPLVAERDVHDGIGQRGDGQQCRPVKPGDDFNGM
ncbi:hypothetical protein [Mesorhizobium australicum]|uniref:hypothetical protein n=1 Tax=Mesorhizobium australicum TaxID=536018 RepID=UPI00333A6F5D